jgi:hypothetical protein
MKKRDSLFGDWSMILGSAVVQGLEIACLSINAETGAKYRPSATKSARC